LTTEIAEARPPFMIYQFGRWLPNLAWVYLIVGIYITKPET
jgi:hypothetical protein